MSANQRDQGKKDYGRQDNADQAGKTQPGAQRGQHFEISAAQRSGKKRRHDGGRNGRQQKTGQSSGRGINRGYDSQIQRCEIKPGNQQGNRQYVGQDMQFFVNTGH